MMARTNNKADNYRGKQSSQELTPTSQRPDDEQVKELVNGLQTQELFGSCSTPVVKTIDKGKGKKAKKTNNINSGIPLNKAGGNRQLIFNPNPEQCSSKDLLRSVEASQPQIDTVEIDAVEITHDNNSKEVDELPQSGQQRQQQPLEFSPNDKQKEDTSQEDRRNNIEQFMIQFIQNKNPDTRSKKGDAIGQAKRELYQLYLKQMKIKDRAQRQLGNIRFCREKNGRVPAGMRIKVKPEVQANEDIIFCQKWAEALCQAEDLLANCIEQHLENVIDKCDDFICDKVNITLDVINDSNFEGNPFDLLKETLTEANSERQKTNEAIRKRKRDNI